MSIPELIYIVGCVVAFVMAFMFLVRESAGDVTVLDLFMMLIFCFVSSLLSWFLMLIVFVCKYGDKVVIRHRKDGLKVKEDEQMES